MPTAGPAGALAAAVRALRSEKRFLFRSAASLVKALADPGPPPLDGAGLAALRRRNGDAALLPGLVVVGSYVPLADQQLERLLQDPGCHGLELPVRRIARVLESGTPDLLLADLERDWLQQLREMLKGDATPVLYSSRGELGFASLPQRRHFLSWRRSWRDWLLLWRRTWLPDQQGRNHHADLAVESGANSRAAGGAVAAGAVLGASVRGAPRGLPILTLLETRQCRHPARRLAADGGRLRRPAVASGATPLRERRGDVAIEGCSQCWRWRRLRRRCC